MTGRAHCSGHELDTKWAPPGGVPLGLGGWHHGDVPRDWHLERYPGKYVAIDMATDEVVLTADTPQELEAAIREQGLKNVATMRAPRPDEPLFVGGH